MAANPNFVANPQTGTATISTANLNRNGTGTIGTVFTAGASGARIDAVSIKATGTTAAGTVVLYVSTDGGVTWTAIDPEIAVSAIAVSATVASFGVTVLFPGGLQLQANARLGASTTIAQEFDITTITSGGYV